MGKTAHNSQEASRREFIERHTDVVRFSGILLQLCRSEGTDGAEFIDRRNTFYCTDLHSWKN